MPSLTSHMPLATDYDSFRSRDYNEDPLTLDRAVAKASELRKSDGNHFYKVVPVDPEMTGFRVEIVSPSDVYAKFLIRFSKRLGRFAFRAKVAHR